MTPRIFERHWQSVSSTGLQNTSTSYYAICDTCKTEIEGPTVKRVKYLLESHEYWIHSRGLAA